MSHGLFPLGAPLIPPSEPEPETPPSDPEAPPSDLEEDAEDNSAGSGDDVDLEVGEIALQPSEAWWEVRRQWAEAVVEAGPIPPAAFPSLRTVQQTDRSSSVGGASDQAQTQCPSSFQMFLSVFIISLP